MLLEDINHIALIGSLMQQMCVYLAIAYLLSKTPLFAPLMQVTVRLPDKLVCYFVFSSFCIMGTYLGFQIEGAIANTRAIGAVLGGIFGGPVVGLGVGLTGGLHRYFMGGFTASACAVSTTMEGLIGGLLHYYLMRQHRAQDLLSPAIAFGATMVAEMLQMFVLLIMAKPFDQATRLVAHIALPMILTNSCGAALFISMIRDQQQMYEKFSRVFSAKALNIANRTVGIMSQGFTPEASLKIACIIQEETGVGAVAITDTDKILAFIGIGEEHLPLARGDEAVAQRGRLRGQRRRVHHEDLARRFRERGGDVAEDAPADAHLVGSVALDADDRRVAHECSPSLTSRPS